MLRRSLPLSLPPGPIPFMFVLFLCTLIALPLCFSPERWRASQTASSVSKERQAQPRGLLVMWCLLMVALETVPQSSNIRNSSSLVVEYQTFSMQMERASSLRCSSILSASSFPSELTTDSFLGAWASPSALSASIIFKSCSIQSTDRLNNMGIRGSDQLSLRWVGWDLPLLESCSLVMSIRGCNFLRTSGSQSTFLPIWRILFSMLVYVSFSRVRWSSQPLSILSSSSSFFLRFPQRDSLPLRWQICQSCSGVENDSSQCNY